MSEENRLSVLELINEVAVDEECKDMVTVLPLMCGTGKSTAISYKIKQCIEDDTGILIVTDRKKRLQEYLSPRDKSLEDYINQHKDKIALIISGNNPHMQIGQMHKCPVVLLTTQRYFSFDRDELMENYLKWDKGQRSLIIFDEQPLLYTDYKLDHESLTRLETALMGCISERHDYEFMLNYFRAMWQRNKEECVRDMMNYQTFVENEDSYSLMHTIPEKIPFEIVADLPYISVADSKLDIAGFKEAFGIDILERNYGKEIVQINHDGYWGKKEAYQISHVVYDLSIEKLANEEDQGRFCDAKDMLEKINDTLFDEALRVYVKNNKTLLTSYYTDAFNAFKAFNYFLTNGTLFSFRSRNTGKFECYYQVAMNNKKLMDDLGTKVIVLDGTADLSPDYDQDYIQLIDCSEYKREIPNLHIRIVQEPTGRQKINEKIAEDPAYFEAIREFIKKETGIDNPLIFTFKEIADFIKAEKDKETKAEAEDEINKAKAIKQPDTDYDASKMFKGYLGNLRGSNEFLDFKAFAQVGLFRKPVSYYLSHFIDREDVLRVMLEDIADKRDYTSGYVEYIKTEDGRWVMDENQLNREGSQRYQKMLSDMREIEKDDVFINDMYLDIMADVEQNIFRAPIRNPNFTDDTYYYLFYDLKAYANLTDMIVERFRDYYGADVQIIDNSLYFDLFKAMNKTRTDSSTGKKEPTDAAKIIKWVVSEDCPLDKKFKLSFIAESVGLTSNQVAKAREKNQVLDDLMTKMKDETCKSGEYIKKADLLK